MLFIWISLHSLMHYRDDFGFGAAVHHDVTTQWQWRSEGCNGACPQGEHAIRATPITAAENWVQFCIRAEPRNTDCRAALAGLLTIWPPKSCTPRTAGRRTCGLSGSSCTSCSRACPPSGAAQMRRSSTASSTSPWTSKSSPGLRSPSLQKTWWQGALPLRPILYPAPHKPHE